jgi:hypothetical protein
MNYIISEIDSKIEILEGLGEKEKTKSHIQAKFEYYLIHILAYLWNKNIDKLPIDKKEYVINTVIKPSIGSIISTARTLDIEKEIFGNKKLKKFYQSINEYPRLRNEKVGHGYSFEDNTDEFISVFSNLLESIEEGDLPILNQPHDIIHVIKDKNDLFSGIRYTVNGKSSFWSCSKQVFNFEVNSIYTFSDVYGYNKISPFIYLQNDSFFIFSSIEEKLTGRVKYNQLLKTGKTTAEFEEFATFISYSDALKSKSANGTIITKFQKYFKKYIDVGISKKILNFLLKNQSSVFATVWGYGGVGKTSSIQSVCEELSHQEKKKFDYIIFLSAKDRYYNYYKGKIEYIDTSITSLDNIILLTNKIIFGEETLEIEKIINYEGKMLLVIDDFETFDKSEQDRITAFIRQLNINYHKVIITTRSATLITGEEISANELDKKQTLAFTLQAIINELPSLNIKKHQKDIQKNIDLIWTITSGRPLFIFQFVILLGQKGAVSEIVSTNIRDLKEAKNFLYDRIYDYLSKTGKNMFVAISLITNKDDLTGTIKSLRFIMNMEDETNEYFDFSFAELVKLKLLIRESDNIFKVYSTDVLKIMSEHYDKKGEDYDGDITSRYNLIGDSKENDVDYAMLEVADSKRLVAKEVVVENLYRRILNREQAPIKVKIKAISNYAHYLMSFKRNTTKTLRLFKTYYNEFKTEPDFILTYSKYSWSSSNPENKRRAIKLITDFLSTRPKIKDKSYTELLCLLMTYSSILNIEQREELKSNYRFQDITEDRYNTLYKKQKSRFSELYNYPGNKILNIIANKNLINIESSLRSLILEALVHYCEICIQVRKYTEAKNVINRVMTELPPADYQNPFVSKMLVIERIEKPELFDKYGRKKEASALGILLKEALDKENE